MSNPLIDSVASGASSVLAIVAIGLVLVGGYMAALILKGDVYHSVAWLPWAVPAVAWLAAAVCAYFFLT